MQKRGTKMKTSIFIIILAIFTVFLGYADDGALVSFSDFIDFHASIELGFLPRASDEASLYANDWSWSYKYSGTFYVTFETSFVFWKILTIGGSMRCIFKEESLIRYNPMLNRYTIFANIKLGQVIFGFEHYCEHTSETVISSVTPNILDRSEEKVYIKLGI
jgi:hypothetical protein